MNQLRLNQLAFLLCLTLISFMLMFQPTLVLAQDSELDKLVDELKILEKEDPNLFKSVQGELEKAVARGEIDLKALDGRQEDKDGLDKSDSENRGDVRQERGGMGEVFKEWSDHPELGGEETISGREHSDAWKELESLGIEIGGKEEYSITEKYDGERDGGLGEHAMDHPMPELSDKERVTLENAFKEGDEGTIKEVMKDILEKEYSKAIEDKEGAEKEAIERDYEKGKEMIEKGDMERISREGYSREIEHAVSHESDRPTTERELPTYDTVEKENAPREVAEREVAERESRDVAEREHERAEREHETLERERDVAEREHEVIIEREVQHEIEREHPEAPEHEGHPYEAAH